MASPELTLVLAWLALTLCAVALMLVFAYGVYVQSRLMRVYKHERDLARTLRRHERVLALLADNHDRLLRVPGIESPPVDVSRY